MEEKIDKLHRVLTHLKHTFVGKDEIIDLLGIGLIARENVFLMGPPGTAKSAIVKALSQSVSGGSNFEYLLTRFTEPNEIFGPFDIRKLKEGELVTNTDGMMPEASVIFLDEIFNANSAILNSLLTALNEKIFKRGKETKHLPALTFVGASNVLPEEEALAALLDRFLIRVNCEYVEPDKLHEVLIAGRKLDSMSNESAPSISVQEIKELQAECKKVELENIRKHYVDVVHSLRSTGIAVSDRRAVKLQNIIAASALISGRKVATISDMWVLRYIWDTREQVEILESLINNIIEKDTSLPAHPQASMNKRPNAEEIMAEVNHLTQKWETVGLSFEEQNVIKDKLRYVHSRSEWISNKEQKEMVHSHIESLWQKILQKV